MKSELPDGWIVTDIQSVCEKVTDGTHHSPSLEVQTLEGDFMYITAKNIKEWGVDLSDVTYVPEQVHRPIYSRCNPESGDVLYIKDGVTTGIATVNPFDEEFSLLSSVALLKPRRDVIDPHYLKWYLNSPLGYRSMTSQMSGTAIRRLILKRIKQGQIPLAPLEHQRRIVAKLEALLSDLDACVAALERAQANLTRYRSTVLKAAVEGKLTEEWRAEHPDLEPASVLLARILVERRAKWEKEELHKYEVRGKKPPARWREKYRPPYEADEGTLPSLPRGWCWATADQLTDETRAITYGVVKLGDHVDDGVPTLRSSNVRHLELELDHVKRIDERIAGNYRRTVLQGGEVLVTVRGTLGGVVVVPTSCAGYNISREVAMLALVEPRVGPAVASFIASKRVQNWILRHTRGITYTGINIDTVKRMPLPLAPLHELDHLQKRVTEQLAAARRLFEAGRIAQARSRVLRQSILKAAFRGELTETERHSAGKTAGGASASTSAQSGIS